MALKGAALPTYQELLFDDGVPLENAMHGQLSWNYLVRPLQVYFQRIGFRAFVSSNSAVHYAVGVDPVGPDVYVVNGGEDHGEPGWVSWLGNGLLPTLIIEMLSPSTEHADRGSKKQIYQDIFRASDYFLFQSETGGVEAYHLRGGRYVRGRADRHGRFRCLSLDLSLGVVDGALRWFERNGVMLPEYRELTNVADQERERADRAEAEVRRLREELNRLREGSP